MEKRPATPPPATVPKSRRRDLRFTPPPQLTCAILGMPDRVEVRDISVGGVALRLSQPLAPWVVYTLTLQLGTLTVILSAKAMHCTSTDDYWVVGMAFLDAPSLAPNIGDLIDAIAASSLEFS